MCNVSYLLLRVLRGTTMLFGVLPVFTAGVLALLFTAPVTALVLLVGVGVAVLPRRLGLFCAAFLAAATVISCLMSALILPLLCLLVSMRRLGLMRTLTLEEPLGGVLRLRALDDGASALLELSCPLPLLVVLTEAVEGILSRGVEGSGRLPKPWP